MKQLLIKKGKAFTDDLPAPMVGENNILVQVGYSSISVGTEMASVLTSGESLFKKILNQPQKIKKAVDLVKTEGLSKTAERVRGKMEEIEEVIQAGYSAAGTVVETGPGIKDISVGDMVACAGAGIANHAGYIVVPRNLLVKVPNGVNLESASTVTMGAIAMQGVRRADVKLGEFVAIVGLGILGQITAQLLRANGCRVIGIDPDERRIDKAIKLGVDKGINPGKEDVIKVSTILSGGYGVDAVIITAATQSKEPLAQAFKMCRKKGRVVLVGVVGMEINREDMYKKELDFLISTSYGPGRYDEKYELQGIDYPYGYVRWSENRNMEEYLRLIANGKIDIQSLIEQKCKIEEASKVYEDLKTNENKPLIILIEYDHERESRLVRRIDVQPALAKAKDGGLINVAVVGAGSFAKGTHLPNLSRAKDIYKVYAIASKTGSNAKFVAKKYGAKFGTTDFNEIIEDPHIDAVIIATRHNLHAQMASKALKAGKAVLLEKPMALNKEELDELVNVIKATGKHFMVGFNRRFSKYAREIKKHVSTRTDPMIINYQMNAGHIPTDHWVHNEEGGGRIIGEACHIFDLFNYFTDAEVVSISVDPITPKTKYFIDRDNAVITLKYNDGSICTLTYTTLGNNQYPKEVCQIYFDGKTIAINDYKQLDGFGVKLPDMKSSEPEKGQYEEIIDFARYLKGEVQAPIPLWQLVHATEISFKAGNQI